jgi:hypothetical protein
LIFLKKAPGRNVAAITQRGERREERGERREERGERRSDA